MKKYLLRILLFFIAIAVLDYFFGIAFQYMNDHSRGGGIKSRQYVCKESNEEVLVFGSSRARHHYVPDIIEDSLGLTCYNTGEDGNGIIYCYGVLKMITQRYKPKLIIYDVSVFDIYKDDNVKYLDFLKPFYYEPGIDSIFWDINSQTRLMMHSNFYRFNTSCVKILGSYLHPIENFPKGYNPIQKTMEYRSDEVVQPLEYGEVDDCKIHYFERFIKLAKEKNIKVICCVSPFFNGVGDKIDYTKIEQLLNEYSIPFFCYANDIEICKNSNYFKDHTHLNDAGARCYTQKLMNELRSDSYFKD